MNNRQKELIGDIDVEIQELVNTSPSPELLKIQGLVHELWLDTLDRCPSMGSTSKDQKTFNTSPENAVVCSECDNIQWEVNTGCDCTLEDNSWLPVTVTRPQK